jgi:small glutamine-rich tetratricopeptide repeat-containing protein alpha
MSSDSDQTVVGYSIVNYLVSLSSDANSSLDKEKLNNAAQLLSEVFNVSTNSTEDFKNFSLYPASLGELVSAGRKSLEAEPYSVALATAQSNGKYEPFVETVSKKGYFSGVDEGSLEYLQRSAKLNAKFREKINASKPAPSSSSSDKEAAAEAKKMEGNAAVTAKDYKLAVSLYGDAIQLSPQGPNSHIYYTNRAAAHCYLKDYEAAARDCERSVQLDPLYVKAYSRLGLAYFFMNKYDKAVEAYERAVELEPDTKALKDSLRQAQQKLDERKVAPSSSSSSSAAPLNPPAGGMPDLASLSQMMGGLGGADGGGLAALMQNPQVMAAAQQMMQNPAMMQQAMSRWYARYVGDGGYDARDECWGCRE